MCPTQTSWPWAATCIRSLWAANERSATFLHKSSPRDSAFRVRHTLSRAACSLHPVTPAPGHLQHDPIKVGAASPVARQRLHQPERLELECWLHVGVLQAPGCVGISAAPRARASLKRRGHAACGRFQVLRAARLSPALTAWPSWEGTPPPNASTPKYLLADRAGDKHIPQRRIFVRECQFPGGNRRKVFASDRLRDFGRVSQTCVSMAIQDPRRGSGVRVQSIADRDD